MRLLLALALFAACPKDDPYKNVTPQKVKQQVEQIQKQEEERNDKRLDELK